MLLEDLIPIVLDRYTTAEFVDLIGLELVDLLVILDGWELEPNLLNDLRIDDDEDD